MATGKMPFDNEFEETALPVGTSLDSVVVPGTYSLWGTYADAWTDSNIYGHMIVLKRPGTTATYFQLFFQATSNATSRVDVRYRPYANGQWYNWKLLGNDMFTVPNVIANGTDLNDLVDPGVYECQSATSAASLVNSPVASGFSMFILRINGSNRNQVLSVGGTMYTRIKTSTGWSAWKKIALKEEIPLITYKNYTITLAANSNVAPFSTYAEVNIASDVSAYGTPIAVKTNSASTNPTMGYISAGGASMYVVGKSTGSITATITFLKQ